MEAESLAIGPSAGGSDTVRMARQTGGSLGIRMGEEFDVYCAASALDFHVGAVVALDGIDGFFDQYFDAVRPQAIIRFAVLPGGPSKMPHSLEQFGALPFVTARVERCDAVGGDVEILSLSTLGDWSRALELTPLPLTQLQRECRDAPLKDLVAEAARGGSAYWRSNVPNWRSLSETTAVGAIPDGQGVRVTIIWTNGVPGLVARVNPPAT